MTIYNDQVDLSLNQIIIMLQPDQIDIIVSYLDKKLNRHIHYACAVLYIYISRSSTDQEGRLKNE